MLSFLLSVTAIQLSPFACTVSAMRRTETILAARITIPESDAGTYSMPLLSFIGGRVRTDRRKPYMGRRRPSKAKPTREFRDLRPGALPLNLAEKERRMSKRKAESETKKNSKPDFLLSRKRNKQKMLKKKMKKRLSRYRNARKRSKKPKKSTD
mmetsp:Transcript_21517/g.52715  ORF Transcript_21517/g.52715 Transcript_21517/m.52715 type:complete len:154 (-) Transcript_21517:363-824(-)